MFKREDERPDMVGALLFMVALVAVAAGGYGYYMKRQAERIEQRFAACGIAIRSMLAAPDSYHETRYEPPARERPLETVIHYVAHDGLGAELRGTGTCRFEREGKVCHGLREPCVSAVALLDTRAAETQLDAANKLIAQAAARKVLTRKGP